MIGVLSDAHGHGAAFHTAIEALRVAGADRFVFLGDAVGYIPGRSVLQAISDLGDAITCVRGNHDEMVASGHLDPGREAVYQHQLTRLLLKPEDLAIVTAWPKAQRLTCAAGRLLFVHGSPADPTRGYVYPETSLEGIPVDADFVFMGHTHRPFIRRHGATCFVNVGSCSLPRDEGGRGAAVIFDPHGGNVSVVRFDIRAQTRDLLQSVRIHPMVVKLLERELDNRDRQ